MACTITVTSVIGVPAGPGFNPPGAVSAIIISGTATNLASVIVDLFTAVQAPVTNGQWQVTVAVPRVTPNTFEAACGETITFFVTDPTETECAAGWSQPLACPTCPQITVDPPTIGDCAADGTRPVTLTVHINQPAGQPSVFQWDYGDGALGNAFPDSLPALTNVTTHNNAPGNYTATLKTILPRAALTFRFSYPYLPAPAPRYRTSPSARETAIHKATGRSRPRSPVVLGVRSSGSGVGNRSLIQGAHPTPLPSLAERPRR